MNAVESAKSNPTTYVIDLTPDLAKFILDVNTNNRSVRNVKIVQYATDMAAGNWALNGEPIIIADTGDLNDGQHRCLAVIESNTAIQTSIAFGYGRETRLTLDQGTSRTAGDFLGMEGVANASLVAAIARMVIAYEYSEGKNLAYRPKVTSAAVRQRSATDLALGEAATFGHTNGKYAVRFAPSSLIGFVYYVLARSDPREARDWMERLCRNDGLKIRSAAHTLREKLTSTSGKTPQDRKIVLFLKAWNFHRRGMNVSASSLNTDLPFPAIL